MKKILAGIVIFGLLLITFFYVFSRTSDIFDENRAEKLLLSPTNQSISYEIDDKDTTEDLIEQLNKGKQTSSHLKKNVKKPDYIAKAMFGRTNGTSFQLTGTRSDSKRSLFIRRDSFFIYLFLLGTYPLALFLKFYQSCFLEYYQ